MKKFIKLPKLAANMEKGKVTKWLKQVGEKTEKGEPLVEVTTGKINVQMDTPFTGRLFEILVPAGFEAPVGANLGILEITETLPEPIETKKETGEEAVTPQSQIGIRKKEHFDVVIIGGGPGGYVAAIRAAQLGGKVALAEKDKLGGTCLNRGCIPSKAMIKSAGLYTAAKKSAEYGVQASGLRVNISKIMEHKSTVVNQLRIGVEQLMHDNGIKVYHGKGSLAGKNQVTVTLKNDTAVELTAKDIIIASGSLPAGLPVPGSDLPEVLNSDTVLEIDQIPQSLVIIGGGYIAIEMGCFFNAVGAKVTIIEMQSRILPFADKEISDELEDILKNDGISIHTGTKVRSIVSVQGGGLAVLASDTDDEEKLFYCEKVLNATGRVCNYGGLNLEASGIEINEKAIAVNRKMQTNIANIYAIGDVTGKAMLAHVASNQGIIAAENIMGNNVIVDYSVIPSVVFSRPEIGYVGLTEEEARRQNLDYVVSRFPFAALGKALTTGETKGWCKLLSIKSTGQILGVHIIGPEATDLIAIMAVSMKSGITVTQLAQTIFAHPTMAEIISETANMAIGTPINLPGRS